jgi:hypothetical protein
MRSHCYAVQASVGLDGAPQAAVVGIAVGDNFEIVFDTLGSTRKARNLSRDPRISFVIGGTDIAPGEVTVQYDGVAELPAAGDLAAVRELYFGVFPDGRDRLAWPGIVHFRVRPKWLRYSDFRSTPPAIVELGDSDLMSLR